MGDLGFSFWMLLVIFLNTNLYVFVWMYACMMRMCSLSKLRMTDSFHSTHSLSNEWIENEKDKGCRVRIVCVEGGGCRGCL